MGNYNERILQLLWFYLLRYLSDDKREENRRFFKRIQADDLFAKEFVVYRKIDEVEAKRKLKLRVGLVQRKERNLGRLLVIRALPYAAVLVVGLIMVIIGQQYRTERNTIPVALSSQTIRPGHPQATLVLAEGQKVILQEEGKASITVEPGMMATRENGRLVYTSSVAKDSTVVKFNELVIPRGGEYQLMVGDSSHVQMNSASTLRYPVVFNRQERRVYLTGRLSSR